MAGIFFIRICQTAKAIGLRSSAVVLIWSSESWLTNLGSNMRLAYVAAFALAGLQCVCAQPYVNYVVPGTPANFYVPDTPQISVPEVRFPSGSQDLPLDQEPLQRAVTGFQPEQVNLIYISPTEVTVTWNTGACSGAGSFQVSSFRQTAFYRCSGTSPNSRSLKLPTSYFTGRRLSGRTDVKFQARQPKLCLPYRRLWNVPKDFDTIGKRHRHVLQCQLLLLRLLGALGRHRIRDAITPARFTFSASPAPTAVLNVGGFEDSMQQKFLRVAWSEWSFNVQTKNLGCNTPTTCAAGQCDTYNLPPLANCGPLNNYTSGIIHHTPVMNLQPATTYYYQVRCPKEFCNSGSACLQKKELGKLSLQTFSQMVLLDDEHTHMCASFYGTHCASQCLMHHYIHCRSIADACAYDLLDLLMQSLQVPCCRMLLNRQTASRLPA